MSGQRHAVTQLIGPACDDNIPQHPYAAAAGMTSSSRCCRCSAVLNRQETYCPRCWWSWGCFVRRGGKYELSTSCEALANRLGVEFNYDPGRRSNPFKCKLCQNIFNSGNLEGHLRVRHAAALRGHQPVDITTPPYLLVLHVSGATDASISQIIRGTYTTSEWHHGKPVYRKVCQDAPSITVLIYYWDGRDNAWDEGWWFSPELGADTVYAYSEATSGSNLPPASGWVVYSSAGVVHDNKLNILMNLEPKKDRHPVGRPSHNPVDKPLSAYDVVEQVEPIVYVSGCSSAAVSCTIRGAYILSAWNHEKPVYRKLQQQASDSTVLIYYWGKPGAVCQEGWRFGASLDDQTVWAFNESQPQALSLPLLGWKVPHDGDVDDKLNISTEPDTDLSVEVVWEFLSTDWQPVSREMQNELESRWVKGWDAAEGDDDGIFCISTNGYTYGIDCHDMLQRNLDTGRSREIRRTQRLQPPVIPELFQNLQRSLQREIQAHMAEKSELAARVVELEQQVDSWKSCQATVADLKQQIYDLEPCQVQHEERMVMLEPWRMSRQLDMNVRAEVPLEDGLYATLQKALISACPADHRGDCSYARSLNITGLEQVHNIRLWKSYEFRKEQVKKELEGSRVPKVTSGFSGCSWAKLDSTVNEIWVLHGTTPDKVDLIVNFGFDERLARERGLYGQGVYFTDQTCKAFQYSGAGRQAEGCFIITRLILGEPHYARGPLPQVKVEPLRDPKDTSKGRCHSVIAAPGTPSGNGATQVHRELVIFNGAQAYPEMIVCIRK